MRMNENKQTERIVDEYFSPQSISLANMSRVGSGKYVNRDCNFEGNVKKCRRGDSVEY
mgnify:CR=1 FL=1